MCIRDSYSAEKFERAFRESLIETGWKIIRNSPAGAVQDFLKTYFMLRFECENIKTILRAASVGLPFKEISRRIYMKVEDYLKRRDPITHAITAINVRSVVDALKATEYGPILSTGLKRYEKTGALKFFDVLIDKMFYETLGEAFEGLPERERPYALPYVSMENDGFNLCTILRAKNLGYDPHWIRMAISRKTYNVPQEMVESLVMASDFDSALKIVRQSYYKSMFMGHGSPEEVVSAAEEAFKRAILAHAKKTRVGDLFNVGVPLGFLIQKEVEVHNLITVSLGIEYGWKPDRILALLLL